MRRNVEQIHSTIGELDGWLGDIGKRDAKLRGMDAPAEKDKKKAEEDKLAIENKANLKKEEKDKLIEEIRKREKAEEKAKTK